MAKSNIVYGLRPIYEALTSGKELEKVLIQKGLRGSLYADVWQFIKSYTIPYQFVPVEKLNGMTSGNHQGMIAYVSPIEYQDITAVLPMIFDKGEMPLLLVLDRITDVRNFGAIARTASCAGVHAIIVPIKGSAQINADAIKTSAGALHNISVCRSANMQQTLRFLQESGVRIFGATEKASQIYDTVDYRGPAAIVMGSEEDGISKEILQIADELVSIPLLGEIASLNVSVANGIMLFEALRQRRLNS